MPTDIQERRRDARPAAERYAGRTLRRALGWGDAPAPLEIPASGSNSLIYIARPEGHAPAVIKAFEDARSRRRLLRALGLGRGRDLPIPRVLHAGWGPVERARFGLAFVTTECMTGETLPKGEAGGAAAQAMAGGLARLHATRSSRWGKPGNLRGSPIRDDWRRGVRRRLGELRGAAPEMGDAESRRLADWFERTIDALPDPAEFHLCHCCLAPDDMVFDAATGRLTFIDCDALQFTRAARDLAALHYHCFIESPAGWAAFLDRYFEGAGPDERESTERELPFFIALILLGKARRRPQWVHAGQTNLDRLRRATAAGRPIAGR